ncbi:AF4/FMR2 family member 3 isoform X1 [Pelobates fuscus]|uniref:AF4/FMR2 family member 3 isoform X1 n=2 Tax=Pelobates fuscus TaxID=191477 RepID=UPI002FE4A216
MDSLDLALLQEWDLDDLCGYDQDKNLLRRKEWERRTQELQEGDDDFHSNYPLFSEPYKTSKGDELSNRIQSTLGNYEELKDLLTDQSNQSHLVGIPKSDTSQNPVQRAEEHISEHPRDLHYTLCGTVQTGNIPITLSVQLNNRTTMNWPKPGHSSESQEIKSKDDQRTIDSSVDFTNGHQNHVTDKNRGFSLSPSVIMSSCNDLQQNMLPCTLEGSVNKQMPLSKLNGGLELAISIKENSCTKTSSGTHSTQNFPSSITSKLNAVQQKPTAYVRPMDGQDQAPNESPKLKASSESDLLFPLFRGLTNKPDCEITQSDKRETLTDPDPGEDNRHTITGFSNPNHDDLKVRSPISCAAQISTLADDLKLSSDEEDIDQQAAQGPAVRIQSDSVCSAVVQECSSHPSLVSIKGSSSSSSESDTSSESDSESASSSSDSENCKPSGFDSPEPEPPTSNKWQLDKWLNKVNPHRSSILNHTHGGLSYDGDKESLKGCEKVIDDCKTISNSKDIENPGNEDQRQRTTCTVPSNKVVRVKTSVPITLSFPTESTSRRRPICRKLTRRAERTSSGENRNCNTSFDTSLSQGNLGSDIAELTKNRLICSRGLHKKEASLAILGCERKQARGPSRFVRKEKEFSESLSQSLDDGRETELEVSPLSKSISSTALSETENNCRLKDCGNNNIVKPNSCCTTAFANSRTTSDITQDLEEQLYTLVPFGRNDNVHSLKGSDEVKSLWVRIDLTLLSRIPEGLSHETFVMNSNRKEALSSPQNGGFTSVSDSTLMKMRRKRKFENECSQDVKKNYMEKDGCMQPTLSIDNSDSINKRTTTRTNFNRDEVSASKTIGGNMLPPFIPSNRNRRIESQTHVQQRSSSVPSDSATVFNREDLPSGQWSPLSNGHKDSRKAKQSLDSRTCNADYFMQEAKRMKHKADAMMDKFDKVLNYTEAALSFIECGNAMEHGPMESKSPYTMYSETVELIRYALRLKSHSGPNASTQDKKITALCYRCLALLYWRMFRLKKDHAVKYSKTLIDYFKGSSKVPQASSSWISNGKATGAPSPTSPSPSPLSSTGSQGRNTSTGTPSSNSIISIPQRIHQMAANHVSITNSILHSYDYWEIADNLAKDNIEFFNELDALMGPITLHSSMEHLVRYTRQGLHWIRHNPHLL